MGTVGIAERRLPRFDEVTKPQQEAAKKCGRCGEVLPIEAFAKNKAKKDGMQERCRACRASHYINSGYSSLVYWKHLLRDYSLDIDGYADLARKQDFKCALCRTSFEESMLVVDHCHDSGKVRGLLCSPCNRGLGFFRDDSDALARASVYVDRAGGE